MNPTFIDHILEQIRESAFKQVEEIVAQSKTKVEKMRET